MALEERGVPSARLPRNAQVAELVATVAEALHYVDRIAINYKPRALVVYEGDNDTSYFIPPHTIVDQFESIVSKVHATLPETRIYVLSVKPSVLRRNVWDKAQETNELLDTTFFRHDRFANRVAEIDPKGHTTRWTYDGTDRNLLQFCRQRYR